MARCCRIDHDHAAPDKTPANIADGGYEQKQADNVRDEARNDQQERGKEQHDAVHKFAARRPAGGGFRTDFLQDAKSLQAQQKNTEEHRQDDQAERCQNTDLAANHNEAGNFKKWQCKQEQGHKRGSQLIYLSKDISGYNPYPASISCLYRYEHEHLYDCLQQSICFGNSTKAQWPYNETAD